MDLTSKDSADQLPAIAPPPAAESATSTLLGHIEQAGKTELVALKPLVAAVVRKYVAQYEAAHMSGLIGRIERRVLDSVIDSVFGPAEPAA